MYKNYMLGGGGILYVSTYLTRPPYVWLLASQSCLVHVAPAEACGRYRTVTALCSRRVSASRGHPQFLAQRYHHSASKPLRGEIPGEAFCVIMSSALVASLVHLMLTLVRKLRRLCESFTVLEFRDLSRKMNENMLHKLWVLPKLYSFKGRQAHLFM